MPETLLDPWSANVRDHPDAIALIEGERGRTWTRAELHQASATWLQTLTDLPSLARRRVALAEANGPEWLIRFIGLQQAGAVVIPLDPTEPEQARHATATAVKASWICEGGRLHTLARHPRSTRSDLCLIKLTSGSTGLPRPLVFTHAQMMADGRQVCSSMGIRPEDLNLGIIPFGHSYGLGNLIIPLLVQGTPIVTAASPLPSALASLCERWKPTIFPAVPMLLRALLLSGTEPSSIASLRLVISAGAPLPAEVASAFLQHFGKHIHSFYGSSETGGITYDRTGEAALTGRSVGTPVDGVRLEFGRGGRFHVLSAAVMGRGRHSPPDRAQITALGELALLGRTGRTAKIAGRRVDLGEVEKLLRTVPGVTEAHAMPHPARNDALAAAVAGNVEPSTIRATLRSKTALWKIPDRLLVFPELPRTSRGKIDRKKIEQLLSIPQDRASSGP